MWYIYDIPLGDTEVLGTAIAAKKPLCYLAMFFKGYDEGESYHQRSLDVINSFSSNQKDPVSYFWSLLAAWPFSKTLYIRSEEEKLYRDNIKALLLKNTGFKWEQRTPVEWVELLNGDILNPAKRNCVDDMLDFIEGVYSLALLKERLYYSVCMRWPLVHFLNWNLGGIYDPAVMVRTSTDMADSYLPLKSASHSKNEVPLNIKTENLKGFQLTHQELFSLIVGQVPSILPTFVWDYQQTNLEEITYKPTTENWTRGANITEYILMQRIGLRPPLKTDAALEVMRDYFYRIDQSNYARLAQSMTRLKES